ncbi:unnamed protein product, partial [Ixodes hexagonus]
RRAGGARQARKRRSHGEGTYTRVNSEIGSQVICLQRRRQNPPAGSTAAVPRRRSGEARPYLPRSHTATFELPLGHRNSDGSKLCSTARVACPGSNHATFPLPAAATT